MENDKVLLVEDNPAHRSEWQATIQNAGFRCTAPESFDEVQRLLRADRFACVVIDHNLKQSWPSCGHNGVSFAKWIDDALNADSPAKVFLTMNDAEPELMAYYNATGTDCVSKLDYSSNVGAIRQAIQQACLVNIAAQRLWLYSVENRRQLIESIVSPLVNWTKESRRDFCIILEGPKGTGKSTIAKISLPQILHAAGRKAQSSPIELSQIRQDRVGVAEKILNEIYAKAHAAFKIGTITINVLDEAEALLANAHRKNTSEAWRADPVTQLLTIIDRAAHKEDKADPFPFVLIMTTNAIDLMDSRIVDRRAGQIHIDKPTPARIQEYLRQEIQTDDIFESRKDKSRYDDVIKTLASHCQDFPLERVRQLFEIVKHRQLLRPPNLSEIAATLQKTQVNDATSVRGGGAQQGASSSLGAAGAASATDQQNRHEVDFEALALKTRDCVDSRIAFDAIGFDPSVTGSRGTAKPIRPWPHDAGMQFHGQEAQAFVEALMKTYRAIGPPGRAFKSLAKSICSHIGYNADEACIARLARRFKTICTQQ